MSILDKRVIDYYIKGLSLDTRQDIFKALQDIGNMAIKCLLEKMKDTLSIKEGGFRMNKY